MVQYGKIEIIKEDFAMANVKCPKCGNMISGVSAGQTVKCSKCGNAMKLSGGTNNNEETKTNLSEKRKKSDHHPLSTWKLVSGILSMVLFLLVSLQSCAAGAYNALSNNGEASGSGGIILAILMLSGGIVSVATRKSSGNGGNIALIVLFGLASLIGFATAGSYADLNIWATWCLINAVLAIIAMVKNK